MRVGRKALSATLVAGTVAAGVVVASPASADVVNTACSYNTISITKPGSQQCFLYTGGSNILRVGDWWYLVNSGDYKIVDDWHDLKFGTVYINPVAPHTNDTQPCANCVLVSIQVVS
jgi:hypothetical protein